MIDTDRYNIKEILSYMMLMDLIFSVFLLVFAFVIVLYLASLRKDHAVLGAMIKKLFSERE